MREHFDLFLHIIVTLIKLAKPGGVKTVIAENMAMRQQLITLTRDRQRAPTMTTFDRFVFGIVAFFYPRNTGRKDSGCPLSVT